MYYIQIGPRVSRSKKYIFNKNISWVMEGFVQLRLVYDLMEDLMKNIDEPS